MKIVAGEGKKSEILGGLAEGRSGGGVRRRGRPGKRVRGSTQILDQTHTADTHTADTHSGSSRSCGGRSRRGLSGGGGGWRKVGRTHKTRHTTHDTQQHDTQHTTQPKQQHNSTQLHTTAHNSTTAQQHNNTTQHTLMSFFLSRVQFFILCQCRFFCPACLFCLSRVSFFILSRMSVFFLSRLRFLLCPDNRLLILSRFCFFCPVAFFFVPLPLYLLKFSMRIGKELWHFALSRQFPVQWSSR